MFDAVLDRAQVPRRRLGTGALLSVLAYGGLFAAALIISHAGTDAAAVVKDPVFVWMKRPAPAAPLIRGTDQPAHPAVKPTVHPRKTFVAPTVVPVTPPPEATPTTREEATVGELVGSPNGSETGKVNGVLDGTGTGDDTGGDGSSDVFAFGAGMTHPTLLEGRQPQFTRAAIEARVSGVMLVKCVITTEGSLKNCRVLKPLPHMTDEVLAALATQRYTPVTQDGRPIAVDYLFTFRFVER